MKKHGQCYFLTYLRPPKKFSHIFSNFWPILRHLPPCLWLYLKKFLAKHFKIIKYQCTIVTLNRWDWFWLYRSFFLGDIMDCYIKFPWISTPGYALLGLYPQDGRSCSAAWLIWCLSTPRENKPFTNIEKYSFSHGARLLAASASAARGRCRQQTILNPLHLQRRTVHSGYTSDNTVLHIVWFTSYMK